MWTLLCILSILAIYANSESQVCSPIDSDSCAGFGVNNPNNAMGRVLQNQPVAKKKFELPPLGYAYDALEPYISNETMTIHHKKHHQSYYSKLQELSETEIKDMSLQEIILSQKNYTVPYKMAAQAYNHNHFWPSLKRDGGGMPTGEIAKLINRDFGGYDEFKKAINSHSSHFGSGWIWIYTDKAGKLKVNAGHDGDNPLCLEGPDATVLLGIDIWEHAYYVDYRNERVKYIKNVVDHLLNWDYANSQLENGGDPF